MWDSFMQTIGVLLAKLVVGAIIGIAVVVGLWLLLRNSS